MPKIILTKGLPASGKSTWAFQELEKDPNTKRVNKDDLRAMLDNGRWSKSNEKFVLTVRDFIISEALKKGHNIIVDDTNLHEKHYFKMKELVQETNSSVEINDSFLEVSVEECIKRDLKRPNSVGEKVILDMHKQAFPVQVEVIKQDNQLPKAVIFDVDGTLAIKSDRNPYDWDRVSEDSLNLPVAQALWNYQQAGYRIVVLTGRDGVCENQTKDWLEKNNIIYDYFGIRKTGDTRKDSVIKKELFDDVIKYYYVTAVYDDRDQVVKMWREMGIACFQVDYGDF
jgi:predicted kinase